MNGFMMCVLLAATGQVGDAAERDYGWQINPADGKLEYIVQLSLDKANHMVSAAQEQESDVPSDVAARLSRVVVRIGTEPIVSTPIEEVRKLPVVTTAVLANIEAAAGRGRFSQLENAPAGEVRNVSGDKPPPSLPSSPSAPLPSTESSSTESFGAALSSAALPEAPGASLAEQASQLGNDLTEAVKSELSGALSSRAAEAMRNPENLLAQNLAPNSGGSGFLNESRGSSITAGPGKFSSTATQASTPPAGSASTSLPATPAGTYPTSPTHQHVPGDPYHNDGTAAAPPLRSGTGSNSGALANSGSGASSYPAGNGSLSGGNTSGNTGIVFPAYSGPSSPYAGGTPPGYNNTSPGYNNTSPAYDSGNGNGMTPVNNGNFGNGNFGNGSFGSVPRGAQNPAPYNQYATPGMGSGMNSQNPGYPAGSNSGYSLPNSVYASDPMSIPSGLHQPAARIAANNAAPILPSTAGGGSNATSANSPSNHTASSGKSDKGRAANHDAGRDEDLADSNANGHSGVENVLPVMFVLSLVVNFYLGMLIRKLLGRYRSLLTSVRGQAV